MPKRGRHGTLHRPSEKRRARHVAEFAGRRNVRDFDTKDRPAMPARGAIGKRLRCVDPIP